MGFGSLGQGTAHLARWRQVASVDGQFRSAPAGCTRVPLVSMGLECQGVAQRTSRQWHQVASVEGRRRSAPAECSSASASAWPTNIASGRWYPSMASDTMPPSSAMSTASSCAHSRASGTDYGLGAPEITKRAISAASSCSEFGDFT